MVSLLCWILECAAPWRRHQRTFAQLFLVGFVLKFVFRISHPALVLLVFAFMIFWAAHAVRGRVKEKQVRVFLPTFVSMLVSYTTVAWVVTAVIVQASTSPSISSPSAG